MWYILILLLIELFVLRAFYRRIKREEPDHYFALKEIGDHGVVKYYIKYFIFRSLPIVIVCLLNYKLFSVFDSFYSDFALRLNLVLVLGEVSLTSLRGYVRYRGTGLSYQHLAFSTVLLPMPYFAELINLKFYNLLPSSQGVLDNIWSGIIIYGILSVLGVFSQSTHEDNRIDFSMFDKNMLMGRVSKYKEFIVSECGKYNADVNLVMAVAIYESMQRPALFRFFERVFVFIFRRPATQGIMQLMSKKVITDCESIVLSIRKYFQETKSVNLYDYSALYDVLFKYNPSSVYVNDVCIIYGILSGSKDMS